ncbi:MAG: single-stranded DNA-binding protein [Oligosphaeraceae bacterium]
MPSVNKVILIGNLTRDPEIRQTNGGSMLASFTLAMSRKYTNGRNELVDETCFVDVTAFQRNAEIIQQYVHRGDPLYVEGRLRYETWDDRTTGAKRSRLSVVCEMVQLLARRGDAMPGAAPEGGYRQGAPAPAPRGGYGMPAAAPAANGYDPAVPPAQYRSASPMPPFPQEGQQGGGPDAPVDDLPF